MENKESSVKEKYFVACCPTAYFWGAVLVAIGVFSLLGSLNVIPTGWGRILWPLVLIGLGVTCLIGTRRMNRV